MDEASRLRRVPGYDSKASWDALDARKARIFVQIASYRDPECQWTLKDLFDKAAHPERVFVGLVWQYAPGQDGHCFVYRPPRSRVRTRMIHAGKSRGVCWARARTQALWRGEEFTLQIDSHMRFERHWDRKLIALCRQTGSAKPVLTAYPSGYTPPDRLERGYVFSMGARRFKRNGILTMEGRPIRVEKAPALPIRGVFCSACFLFAPSNVIAEVPYDPHLYFFGEEISLAVRLWTHGWDLFYPNIPIVYHRWKRSERPTHFDDHPDWDQLDAVSVSRVQHLLAGDKAADPRVLKDMERYGLGTERTLEEYQRYSGIHFARRTFNLHARRGDPYPPFVRDRPPTPVTPIFMTKTVSAHKPRKVLECSGGVVFDNFLPEALYQKIHHYACIAEYERINTRGRIKKVWRIRDGFPLRSMLNLFFFADQAKRPSPKPDWAFPTGTDLDQFAEHLNALAPGAARYIGRPKKDWDRFSATAWIYPAGTALSLHDDGSGVYTGAFTYFLNPHWDIHWGGLLLLLDPRTSQALQEFKTAENVQDYYNGKWIEPVENPFVWEPGLAHCVFPKRNRIVFIHPEAYHLVTKVNADAGDNARMSLAGFFQKRKKK